MLRARSRLLVQERFLRSLRSLHSLEALEIRFPALVCGALLGCSVGGSTGASLPPAPPADAPATSRQVSAPPPSGPETGEAAAAATDPLPAGHPYADLHARLAQSAGPDGSAAGSSTAGADALAPLRLGMAARLQREVEARQWDPENPDRAPTASQLARLSDEIEADAAARQADALRRSGDWDEQMAVQREREQAVKERLDGELRRAMLSRFEEVPLESCATGADSLADLPGDLVRWRTLHRDDFQAEEEGAWKTVVEMGEDTEAGAYVGLAIVCHGGLALTEHGPEDYEARIARLRYVAVLDREQSWWNDAGDHVSEEWTLRHEQVHFDLAEVEARRLNAERRTLMEEVRGRGRTPRGAVVNLQKRWGAHLEKVHADFLALEHRYDRETLHGNDLPRQTYWFERAKRGLAESQLAAGP